MIVKKAVYALNEWNPVCERKLTARIKYGPSRGIVITVYVPIKVAATGGKDDFSNKLKT